jgi:hypothetical protein
VGFENVYIFDDCSNKQEIIEILRDAEGKGVNIFWNKRQPLGRIAFCFSFKALSIGNNGEALVAKSVASMMGEGAAVVMADVAGVALLKMCPI